MFRVALSTLVLTFGRTGQDQMRIIKQRLKEMLPYLEVFLDVRHHSSNRDPGVRSSFPVRLCADVVAHVEEDLQIREHLLEALLDDAHLVLARPVQAASTDTISATQKHVHAVVTPPPYPHTCERKVWKCLGNPCVINGTFTSAPLAL